MQGRVGPQLSDEALDRLARQWFADARAMQPKAPDLKPCADTSGDSDGGLLDWLFGADDGDSDGDGGGD